jgi:Glucose / Sorbosone dehydrogenase
MNGPRTRRRSDFHSLLTIAAILLGCWSAASAQSPLSSTSFAGGIFPVGFVQDPGLPNVQYVVQQGGQVLVVENGVLRAQNFLDLSGVIFLDLFPFALGQPLVPRVGEQGLLGLAFAPDYAVSGRFYVNFVNLSGDTVVARFLRSASDPLRADLGSRFDLRWVGEPGAYIDQPFTTSWCSSPPPWPCTHKGGHLAFGPDGHLYIATGDGGGSNDPLHNAQNPASLLGKMLRIDVNVPLSDPVGYRIPADNPSFPVSGVRPEIWAFGFRNPWRFSFDNLAGGTGALIIGDVGQAAFEEIDYEPTGAGGRNYGWRNFEGFNPNPDPAAATSAPLAYTPSTSPLYEYAREGRSAVIGGYIYRGQSLSSFYQGRYFFADFNGRIWSLGLNVAASGEAAVADVLEHAGLGRGPGGPVSAFGVDSDGELYVVYYFTVAVTVGRQVQLSPGRIVRITDVGRCDSVMPAPDWVCVNGGWVPPDHPLAVGAPSPPPTGCSSVILPAADWVCVNGGWVPPDHPLAGSAPRPPSLGCPSVMPAPDWVCVNGGWVPPDHPLAGSALTPVPALPPLRVGGGGS